MLKLAISCHKLRIRLTEENKLELSAQLKPFMPIAIMWLKEKFEEHELTKLFKLTFQLCWFCADRSLFAQLVTQGRFPVSHLAHYTCTAIDNNSRADFDPGLPTVGTKPGNLVDATLSIQEQFMLGI